MLKSLLSRYYSALMYLTKRPLNVLSNYCGIWNITKKLNWNEKGNLSNLFPSSKLPGDRRTDEARREVPSKDEQLRRDTESVSVAEISRNESAAKSRRVKKLVKKIFPPGLSDNFGLWNSKSECHKWIFF